MKTAVMKLWIAAAAVCLLAVACDSSDHISAPQRYTVTATLPQSSNGTRIGMEYDATPGATQMKISWAVGDKIKVGGLESNALTTNDIDSETGAATFTFADEEPDYGQQDITYGSNGSQIQTADNDYSHLAGIHTMTGTYNTTNGTISFAHSVSILRIALSGLRKSTKFHTLNVGPKGIFLPLLLTDLNTTAEGTFVAWLSMLGGTNIENLTFSVNYADGKSPQSYTHPFPAESTLPAGQLLHCTINMETKVGAFTNGSNHTWGAPTHVVPAGYDYVVYDKASFMAMPPERDKKIIQIANIELDNRYSNEFFGTYNGNGHTIKSTTHPYAFFYLNRAQIANVHTVGIGLAEVSSGSTISHCSSTDAVMVQTSAGAHYFTLCSTNKDKLTGGSSLYSACWYNGAVQGTQYDGYVWNESKKEMQQVSTNNLITNGSINWNYKYGNN